MINGDNDRVSLFFTQFQCRITDILQTTREIGPVAQGEADIGIRCGLGDWKGVKSTYLIGKEIIALCHNRLLPNSAEMPLTGSQNRHSPTTVRCIRGGLSELERLADTCGRDPCSRRPWIENQLHGYGHQCGGRSSRCGIGAKGFGSTGDRRWTSDPPHAQNSLTRQMGLQHRRIAKNPGPI